MKIIIALCSFLLPGTVLLGQENQDTTLISQTIKNEFITEMSYKSLPSTIQEYLNKSYGKEFKISNNKFNSSDVNVHESNSRKLSYVAIADSNGIYILSYEHGGKGLHHHTLIFSLDDDRVTTLLNLITPVHKTIIELKSFLKNKTYSIQGFGEM